MCQVFSNVQHDVQTYNNKRDSRVRLIVFFCRFNLRQQTSETKLRLNKTES